MAKSCGVESRRKENTADGKAGTGTAAERERSN